MNSHTRSDWMPPGRPNSRQRPVWLIPVLASAVAAVVTGGAIFGVAAFTDAKVKSSYGSASTPRGARHKANPPAPTSLSTEAFVKVQRPCDLVPQQTVRGLVPKGYFSPESPGGNVIEGAVVTRCSWENHRSYRPGDLVSSLRRLSVTLQVYGGVQSISSAEKYLNSIKWFFKRKAGVGFKGSAGISRIGPYVQVSGIGNDAVLQYTELESKPQSGPQQYHSGEVELAARYQNVIIEVNFSGSEKVANNANEKLEVPLDRAMVRRGAETAAGGVVKALAACSACRG